MSPAPNTIVLGWGPGLIGYAFALGLSGVSVGQMAFYLNAFDNDRRSIKLVAILVFFLDLLHTCCTSTLFWKVLVACRRNDISGCQFIPWEIIPAIFLCATISFIVQCFYAYRVWIISDKNRMLTGFVLVTALGQYGLGISESVLTAQTRTAAATFTSSFNIPYASSSAACEILISGIILFYLRPGRNGVKRPNSYIHQLVVISVQMGVLNSLVAIVWVLLYFTQGNGHYWTVLPSSILCKLNANSMLAVLNARKAIRSQKKDPISVVPLSTINVSQSSPPP